MKKLAIIGSNGMLGSDLVKYLSPYFSVVSINKDNYLKQIGSSFDVVVNANGNSKRFWANKNPNEDFIASTVSVSRSIFDFHCGIYIYISSPDVYENHAKPQHAREDKKIDAKNLQPYGFNKYLSELIIKKYKEKYLILRSSMILGSSLKKGPIYDIINNNPLFITSQTRLQLITTRAISEIIKTLLDKAVIKQTLNMGGDGTLDFSRIQEFFDKKIQISPLAETQIYEMNIKKIKHLYQSLKTSEEYLQEFLEGCVSF